MKIKRRVGKDLRAVLTVSAFLFLYVLLINNKSTEEYGFLLLGVSPVILIWMVIPLLKQGRYEGSQLGIEESGFYGRKKEEPGTF